MRVVVSAGGTGGHIYPALAIISKIKEMDKNSEILYIGTADRMEATIVPNSGINYVGIEMKGLNRKNLFKNIKVLSIYLKAKKDIRKVLKKFRPDIVLGVGGYITLPVIEEACKLGIKTFIHEQNSIPGLSNKILSKKVDKIGVSLEDSISYFDPNKTIFTGNPRSEEILKVKPVLKSKYGLKSNKKLVLIVMGSLGSLTINNKMKEIIPKFKDRDYEVLFVTGKNYYDEYKSIEKIPSNVKIVPYLDDMLSVMKKTDLMVTRTGASTIAEITAIGIPSVLIPSPYVTHNHQYKNALVLEKRNAAVIVEERDLSSEILLKTIDEILKDPKKYDIMKKNSESLGVKDSASRIYEIIKSLVDEV